MKQKKFYLNHKIMKNKFKIILFLILTLNSNNLYAGTLTDSLKPRVKLTIKTIIKKNFIFTI